MAVGSHDGTLYAGTRDGGVRWRVATGDRIYTTPALTEDGTLYVGTDADRLLAVNARGAFLVTRELGRAMVAAGAGGRIVNIASNCVHSPMSVGLASYAASKGALTALALSSAFELVEHGITVNTVMPGGVITPGAMNARGNAPSGPARRKPPLGMCEPGDIAAAVLFFASPAARRVTGQMLTVDAGLSLT